MEAPSRRTATDNDFDNIFFTSIVITDAKGGGGREMI